VNIYKIVGIPLFVGIVGIQFFPTTRNESDVVLETDFISFYNPPENISNLLKISCYDCHSNNTRYPWYNSLQPVGWFLEKHIEEGKEELNFSEFGGYTIERKKKKLKSAIGEIKKGEMPLFSYTLIHQDAKLSETDRLEIEKWFSDLRDSF